MSSSATIHGGTEASIVRRALRLLRALDGCYAIRLHTGAYGTAGTPDVLAVYHGRAALIEFKRVGRHPTPQQRVQMQRWAAAGARVAVCYHAEEAVALVRDGLEGEA